MLLAQAVLVVSCYSERIQCARYLVLWSSNSRFVDLNLRAAIAPRKFDGRI